MFSEQLTGRKRVNATSAHCDDPQPSSVYVRKREMQIFKTEHVDKRIRRYPCSAPLGMTCHPATAAKQRGVQRQQPGIPRCRWTLNASHRAAPVAHSTLTDEGPRARFPAPEPQRRTHERGEEARVPQTAATLPCPEQTLAEQESASSQAHESAVVPGSAAPCTPVRR